MKKPSKEGFEWSFRDLLITLVIVYMAFAVLALQKRKQAESAITPGMIMIQLWWDAKQDADVDLWVIAPGESIPVSYVRPAGIAFNLLKDDLGLSQEAIGRNYEVIVGRGLHSGEYIVNVHLFKLISEAPIRGRISVVIQQQSAGREVIAQQFELERHDQEITVVRFSIDEHGRLVSGSMNHVYKPMRGK